MSTDNPYNELGQILSEGGEIALALAFAHGWSDDKIAALFARRFLPMRQEDQDRLRNISQAALDAGEAFNQTPTGERVSLEDIPLNPNLDPDRVGSNRIFWIGEFQFPGDESWFQVRGTAADNLTVGEILADLAEEATNRVGRSPAAFGVPIGEAAPAPEVRIILMERKF